MRNKIAEIISKASNTEIWVEEAADRILKLFTESLPAEETGVEELDLKGRDKTIQIWSHNNCIKSIKEKWGI